MNTDYKIIHLNEEYCTKKGFYLLYRPINVPYEKFKEIIPFSKNQYMIESAKAFGNGWIGMKKPKDYDGDLEIKILKGDFLALEFVGPYKNMGVAYRKIMKDNKSARNFYNMYLNDPSEVDESEYRTQILFQTK